MIKVSDIVGNQDCGLQKVLCLRSYDWSIQKCLVQLGLVSDQEALQRVNLNKASKIIKHILWKGLSSTKFEFKSEETARCEADHLVDLLCSPNCTLYTNAEWSFQKNQNPMGSWHPLTQYTYDSGVIFIGENHAACVWAEEDD